MKLFGKLDMPRALDPHSDAASRMHDNPDRLPLPNFLARNPLHADDGETLILADRADAVRVQVRSDLEFERQFALLVRYCRFVPLRNLEGRFSVHVTLKPSTRDRPLYRTALAIDQLDRHPRRLDGVRPDLNNPGTQLLRLQIGLLLLRESIGWKSNAESAAQHQSGGNDRACSPRRHLTVSLQDGSLQKGVESPIQLDDRPRILASSHDATVPDSPHPARVSIQSRPRDDSPAIDALVRGDSISLALFDA